MSALRVLLATVVAALSFVVVGAGPSFACSCKRSDPAGYAASASVVVAGTVTSVVPPPEKAVMSSMDPATYVVAVERVFKGAAGATLEVLSPNSGASCGLENIEPGRRYVVFASDRTAEGQEADQLWASLCGGTARATPKLVAAVDAATATGAPPAGAEPDDTAYRSELAVTFDEPGDGPVADDVLAEWAMPIGLAAGGSLVLLTLVLWVRLARS